MRKFLLAIPLAALVVLGVVFYQSLRTPGDPFASALIDQPVPEFALGAITSPTHEDLPPGLASSDLTGQVALVNIFASWCQGCRVEHPLLMSLAEGDVVPVMGLNWKDKPGDGAAWLARFGNPYGRIGDDAKGQTAISFGITGAPETFVIDHKGRIRHKHTGPITTHDWNTTLGPLVKKLQSETPKQN